MKRYHRRETRRCGVRVAGVRGAEVDRRWRRAAVEMINASTNMKELDLTLSGVLG